MNQTIQNYIEKLPASYQETVVDFLEFLLSKAERQEELEWSRFSLASAMRGMEDEPSEYTLDDLKVRY
ncbi:MAG: DUF2281 domain-containing protein [Anaerolineales bacterium]|nr:DUF2281 domain-containing protein [Anaerolineales bacterium]HQU35340.1 DUF2281 domain-containing protein [Anaerolineales bacterium]